MNERRGTVPKPLLANGRGQALYELLLQLDESQWWSPDRLAAAQLPQLGQLIGYASAHSAFYREYLSDIDVANLSLESFRDIPVLTREMLQQNKEQIDCAAVPKVHGSVSESMTSGSTGTPVKFRTSALTSTVWSAIHMREHLWHERDTDKVSASIRWRGEAIGLPPNGVEFENWGSPVSLFYDTARSYYLNSSSDIGEQISWLQKVKPSYLMTHPSNLRALMTHLHVTGETLQGIIEVRTVGESVDNELRHQVAEQIDAKLVDFYSSEELGYIAIACPEHDHYHVQSESLLLEVLREDGSACDLNEPGRIVLTSLRNFATPLIRYAIGDYGELSEPCSCGRGLPVLKTIHGRVRNMLRRPDGSTSWPNFGFIKFMQVAPIRQFQIVQHSLTEIEFKLVIDQKLTEAQEAEIRAILRERLAHPFNIRLSYHKALSRSAGGKFEDFVSMLPAR
ncbi:MAG: adenylyltransferase [Pseudohongiella sp.]|nr:MAG: adenylyltransferase [Pseudohongiella sp.]